jgi:hypothetical protein
MRVGAIAEQSGVVQQRAGRGRTADSGGTCIRLPRSAAGVTQFRTGAPPGRDDRGPSGRPEPPGRALGQFSNGGEIIYSLRQVFWRFALVDPANV